MNELFTSKPLKSTLSLFKYYLIKSPLSQKWIIKVINEKKDEMKLE